MTGVYFREEDYAGFGRRLAVDAVDAMVALLVYVGLALALFLVGPDDPLARRQGLLVAGVAVWLAYFVLLKWSPLRTVGYHMGGVRLVNLQGRPAGLFAVTLRSAFLIFGPLNYVLDLCWLSGDAQRQALRDKFAHTYVVRAKRRVHRVCAAAARDGSFLRGDLALSRSGRAAVPPPAEPAGVAGRGVWNRPTALTRKSQAACRHRYRARTDAMPADDPTTGRPTAWPAAANTARARSWLAIRLVT